MLFLLFAGVDPRSNTAGIIHQIGRQIDLQCSYVAEKQQAQENWFFVLIFQKGEFFRPLFRLVFLEMFMLKLCLSGGKVNIKDPLLLIEKCAFPFRT